MFSAVEYAFDVVGLDLAPKPRRWAVLQQVLVRLESLLVLLQMPQKRLLPGPCYFQHLIIRNT